MRLDDPATRAIPRTHIHNTIAPAGIVRRPVPAIQPNGTPSDVRELPTGHDCMITMPTELTALLLDLAPERQNGGGPAPTAAGGRSDARA